MATAHYAIEMAQTAKEAYFRIAENARAQSENGDASGAHVKLLRVVDECLDRIIPNDPFSPKRGLRGALSSIYRIKKGRLRICYTGSSVKNRIVVLYISETPRKEGDKNDPYATLTKLVASGTYDEIFERLAIRKRT